MRYPIALTACLLVAVSALPANGEEPGRTRLTREEEDYRIMRRNVPLPPDMPPLVQTEHISFYELRRPPESWRFDGDGRWTGVSR